MAPKVAILHHGYIPHYRVRFYELLAERGACEYVVFHGDPPSWIGTPALPGPFAFAERRVRNHEFRAGPSTLVYQPVLREILTRGYDAVVLSAEVKFVSNAMLALLGPLRRIAVLYWGFGYHPQRGFRDSDKPHGALFDGANFLKDTLTRMADGYLAYTRTGVERLAEIGYARDRAFFMGNTIDMTEQFRLFDQVQAEDPQQIRAALGLRPDSTVLVYIGRLVQFKRVDQLIESVKLANSRRPADRAIETIIIGDGPLDEEMKALAGGDPTIHFLGALPPDIRVARCLRVANGVAIAGAIGLLVNHAFAHGKPVITRDHAGHGAEIEYVRNDGNGLIVPGDIEAFATALADFAASPEMQQRLADGAMQTREDLRIEAMAERFDAAVLATVERKRNPRGVKAGAAETHGD